MDDEFNVTEKVDKTFDKVDKNKDGFLQLDEVKDDLEEKKQKTTDEDLQAVVRVGDTDKDGKLSKKEMTDFVNEV